MRSATMQRHLDMEGSNITVSSTRPKHSTTISVGGNNVKPSSSSLTSPLSRRLSGDLSQILGKTEGMGMARNSYVSSIAMNYSRKETSSRGSNNVSSPVKSPTSVLAKGATSPQSHSTKSPEQSDFSQKPSTAMNSLSQQAPSVKSPSPVLPRSNIGVSVRSADVDVKVNGHNSNNNDSAFNMDFYSSLPDLPSDPTAHPSSMHNSHSLEETSKHKTSSSSQVPRSASSPTLRTNKSLLAKTSVNNDNAAAAAANPPTVSTLPSRSKRPDRAFKTIRKSSRLSPMKGIAENGSFDEGDFVNNHETVQEIPPEKFYVNLKLTNESSQNSDVEEESSVFAGRRDVKDARSLHEKQIVSAKGTVRGFKNRVRAGIATFVDQASNKFNYRAMERGKIVVYTTSVTIVRDTYERCKTTRNILQNHMVRFELRDVYMSEELQRQLRERVDVAQYVLLPQIFLDGIHLGGARDLERLNESGELRKLLRNFPKIQVRSMCDTCGGYRFVPCGVCHGSKKSVHRNNFTEEFCALRCMNCNENGLQRCQDCIEQQE